MSERIGKERHGKTCVTSCIYPAAEMVTRLRYIHSSSFFQSRQEILALHQLLQDFYVNAVYEYDRHGIIR